MNNCEVEPEKLSLDDFLCGADGATPWCRQNFTDYLGDIDPAWDHDELTPLRLGYWLAPSSNAMLLLKQRESDFDVVGYYLPPGAVCIEESHQGLGLGAELILATYEWLGAPPTEGLDEQCFTKAGLAAHVAAWKLGIARGIFQDPNACRRLMQKVDTTGPEVGL